MEVQEKERKQVHIATPNVDNYILDILGICHRRDHAQWVMFKAPYTARNEEVSDAEGT